MTNWELEQEVYRLRKLIDRLSRCNITHLNVSCIPEYISDQAAINGGLQPGDLYRTTSGVTPTTFLKIVPD